MKIQLTSVNSVWGLGLPGGGQLDAPFIPGLSNARRAVVEALPKRGILVNLVGCPMVSDWASGANFPWPSCTGFRRGQL